MTAIAKVNWHRLLSQDRCKDIGIPWEDKELHAIHEEKVPPAYVRDGILTRDEYEEVIEKEEVEGKPLEHMSMGELSTKAAELGVEILSPNASRHAYMEAIRKKEAGEDEEEEEEEEEADEEEVEEEEEVEADEVPKKKADAKKKSDAKKTKRTRRARARK